MMSPCQTFPSLVLSSILTAASSGHPASVSADADALIPSEEEISYN